MLSKQGHEVLPKGVRMGVQEVGFLEVVIPEQILKELAGFVQ